jgi:uncharacterized membrane protein YhaH (DUF805 family)
MLLPLKRYAQFSGRSRRKEYWFFFLFLLIVSMVLMALDSMLGLGGSTSRDFERSATGVSASYYSSAGILTGIFFLATFIPNLAVAIRRLHDIDKSGWWLLIGLVPLIGWIVLIVFYLTDGTRGPNRFGPDPKETPADVAAPFA